VVSLLLLLALTISSVLVGTALATPSSGVTAALKDKASMSSGRGKEGEKDE
jgi:hypothetical protein